MKDLLTLTSIEAARQFIKNRPDLLAKSLINSFEVIRTWITIPAAAEGVALDLEVQVGIQLEAMGVP